jgi:hypothetical protein
LRWLYAETPEERAHVERIRGAMDRFWEAFAERSEWLAGRFASHGTDEIPGWMNGILHPVSPDIAWEFGPGAAGGRHRLAFSAEGAPPLRLLTRELVSRAPAIDGWEVYPDRIAVGLSEALLLTKARTGTDVAPDARALLSPQRDGLVDVVLQVPDAPDDEDSLWGPGLLVLEGLLGERTLQEWVGAVEVTPPPSWFGRWFREARTGIPLADVPAAFAAHREKFTRDRRPWSQRLADPDVVGPIVKAEPPRADDYAAQDDLFVAQAPHVGLWMAQHRGRFAASRFSAIGEQFACLKLDAAGISDADRLAWRDRFADAVEGALGSSGLGAVTGSGTGYRYSYVDVALTDVSRAWPLLADALRTAGAPRRSWLLFFEPALRDEWLAVWPDAEPPPRPAGA